LAGAGAQKKGLARRPPVHGLISLPKRCGRARFVSPTMTPVFFAGRHHCCRAGGGQNHATGRGAGVMGQRPGGKGVPVRRQKENAEGGRCWMTRRSCVRVRVGAGENTPATVFPANKRRQGCSFLSASRLGRPAAGKTTSFFSGTFSRRRGRWEGRQLFPVTIPWKSAGS